MTRTPHIAHTVLCFGLNLVIARLGLDPRWRYAVWGVWVANEIRGAKFAYEGFVALFRVVRGILL